MLGRSQKDVLSEITDIIDRPISGEVNATTVDAEGMIREAQVFVSNICASSLLHQKDIFVKV